MVTTQVPLSRTTGTALEKGEEFAGTLRAPAGGRPRLLVDAVREERRTRRLHGERCCFPETDVLAEHRAYYYVARYDKPSPEVFTTIRTILHEERPDLSVSSMLLGGDWHVVVIGDWPAERVHNRIMEALHGGNDYYHSVCFAFAAACPKTGNQANGGMERRTPQSRLKA